MTLAQGPARADDPLVRLVERIAGVAAARPEAVALRDAATTLSYAGMRAAVAARAAQLRSAGAAPGRVIGICALRGVDLVVAMLAVLETGAAFLPLDPGYPVERLDYMLDDSGCEVVLQRLDDTVLDTSTVRARLAAGQRRVIDLDQAAPAVTEEAFPTAFDPGRPFCLLYTSGSTGRPKGVWLPHRSVANLLLWMQATYPLGQQDRVLQKTPCSFDVSLYEIFWPLLAGASVVLAPPESHKDPAALVRILLDESITAVHFVPSMLAAFLEEPEAAALPNLKRIFAAGEALSVELVRRCQSRLPQTTLHNFYGPTEAGVVSAWDCTPGDPRASVPIGFPVSNTKLVVLDELQKAVADGEPGELYLGGVQLAAGYQGLPAQTAERFVEHPEFGRLYRSGDRARRAADGAFEYLGRADSQVKLGGVRVELGEIEAVLAAHPQVVECVVAVREIEAGDARLLAWFTAREPQPDDAVLLAHLRRQLPDTMVPQHLIHLDQFPHLPNGKVDRKQLAVPALHRPTLASAFVAPGDVLQQRLAGLWAAVLGYGEIGVNDRFFELGGTSLKALQVVARVREATGVRVPIVDFFAAPTIAGFASILRNRHAAGVASWIGQPEAAAHAPAASDTRVRVANRPAGSNEPIAIVGFACRVPGADDVETFWRNLLAGVDGLKTLTEEELSAAGVPAQTAAQPDYVRVAGFARQADCFDHAFFGYTPREAELMDPQQRVLLECAWAAFEHAGIAVDRLPSRSVGVFASLGANSYYARNLATHADLRTLGLAHTLLGADKDYAATRIAFKLDLQGPAFTVQTACSSSGVALHLACQSLRSGECDAALVGGAALPWAMRGGYEHVADGPLSADGRTRAFDAGASGMVLTGGSACVVLKRLSDALADGDTVYAAIRGSALNNDGADKVAFTAPSVDAQARVIEQALAHADVRAESIGLLEAHGTGTLLGDPVETAALTRAWRTQTEARGFCALGSVKSNIGHLDAAAAAAGAIKAALALHHGKLPATLHVAAPNPECVLDESPFTLNTTTRDWPAAEGPRRAALSSFGFGGTNFHAVLEAGPARSGSRSAHTWQLLRLSAKTPEALRAQAAQLAGFLKRNPDTSLADVAWTLDTGRSRFAHRGCVVTHATREAAGRLETAEHWIAGEAPTIAPPVVFMFPGQGAQHAGMGARLYASEAVYRRELDRCADVLRPLLQLDLRELLHPDAGHREQAAAQLRETRFAQPAIFAVSWACAQLWLSLGLRPAAMIGHSIGEFVAATLAGVFTLEDALALIAERGRLMQSMAPGSMLALRLSEDGVRPYLNADIALAAINGPALSVLSGPKTALAALEARLQVEGIAAIPLHTSHAFHSPMMEAAVAPFTAVVARVPRMAPTAAFVSSLTGLPITPEQAVDPAYWAQQMRQTVRFAPGLAALGEIPGLSRERVLLEVGPGQNLSAAARQGGAAQVVSSLPHAGANEADDAEHFMQALGRLWVIGIEVAPETFYVGETRCRVGLPTYPFARVRHWIEPAASTAITATAAGSATLDADAEHEEAVTPESAEALARSHTRRVIFETTGVEIAAADDARSFLELGFDSLVLTQLASRLKSEFKVNLRFRQLLEEFTTLEALAGFLSDHGVGRPGVTDTAAKQRGVAPPDKAELPDEAAPKKTFGAGTRISKAKGDELTPQQRKAFDEMSARYLARTAKSKAYAQEHRAHLADPRTVSGFRPLVKELTYPIVTPRSEGAYLWDLDENQYVDITNGFGCIFFGHRPQWLVDAMREQMEKGFEIGPQTPLAGECARMFSEFTGLPRVAFCNTGSEAVTAAMRLARTVTGKNLIVMHTGDYHGIMDEVLVRGSPSMRSMPAAPGIPPEAVANTLILDYGESKSLEIIRARADELAAVLIEPVQSRRADWQPREYLQELRKICTESGAAFIMDEVITGFRAGWRGAQGFYDVTADLATYGKVIGGGMPVGVVAGQARFMDALDGGFWQYGDDSIPEVGVTYFAGTFVRHPLTLAAVKAVSLKLKEDPGMQARLTARTAAMVQTINQDCRVAGAPVHLATFSSLFKPEFTTEQKFGDLFFVHLRQFGLHVWDHRPCFLTMAHSEADIERIIEGFRYAVAQMQAGGFFENTGGTTRELFADLWRNPYSPPLPAARVGRDADGNPAWFVADPYKPGQWLQVSAREGASTKAATVESA